MSIKIEAPENIEKQLAALRIYLKCLENSNKILLQENQRMYKEYSRIKQGEIDALRDENERLTNLLEKYE